jgi:hypothetical protein
MSKKYLEAASRNIKEICDNLGFRLVPLNHLVLIPDPERRWQSGLQSDLMISSGPKWAALTADWTFKKTKSIWKQTRRLFLPWSIHLKLITDECVWSRMIHLILLISYSFWDLLLRSISVMFFKHCFATEFAASERMIDNWMSLLAENTEITLHNHTIIIML